MKNRTGTSEKAKETKEEFRKKSLGEAGIGYSAGAAFIILAVTFFSLFVAMLTRFPVDPVTEKTIYPDWYLYCSFLLPQLGLAGAELLYFLRAKESFRVVTKGCKWYYYLIAIAIQAGLLFPMSELNKYFILGLEAIGYKSSEISVPSLDGWNLLPAVLVIAVLPALFEETLFRGILARNMYASGWGLVQTICITGALFSIYHGKPEQTLYQFVSGVCLTLVAVKAGSIFPTIVAHFLNNAFILVLQATGYGESIPFGAFVAIVVVSAVLFLSALAVLVFFDGRKNQRGKIANGKRFFFSAAAGIGVCAIEWIIGLVAGFRG